MRWLEEEEEEEEKVEETRGGGGALLNNWAVAADSSAIKSVARGPHERGGEGSHDI